MKRKVWSWMVAVLVLGMAGSVCAATLRTETKRVTFPSAIVTTNDPGLASYWGGGGDMAIDKAGNPHLVSAAGDVGHTGYLRYRRWSAASDTWSGDMLAFEGATLWQGTNDNWWPLAAVDDADRIHLLYWHRMATNGTSGDVATSVDLYHVWCTNASGTTPLTTNNWVRTMVTTIPTNRTVGSLISVGSNTLLYARGQVDLNGDGLNDIRIDKAVWDGSSWVWSEVGMAVSNGIDNSYGGLMRPRLTYDRQNDILHLDYRQEYWPRCQAYTQSSQPTNPVFSSWSSPVVMGNINADSREGNGGVGILEDGRAVALVFLGANRDNMGATTNFSRIREAGSGGTWGSWTVAFSNDTRQLTSGSQKGYAGYTDFAPDGAGGLFAVYDNRYISHWDPDSQTWADVFTNLPAAGYYGNATYPVATLGVSVREYPAASKIFTLNNNYDSGLFYVGTYYLAPKTRKLQTLIMVK